MKKIISSILMCLFVYSCSDDYKKAMNYKQANELDKAVEYLDKAISTNPNNYDAYLEKGMIVSELGDNDDAISCFSKAMSIQPDEPYAYYNRAEARMRLEKYQDALEDYNMALKIVVGNTDGKLKVIPVPNPYFSTVDVDLFTIYASRGVAYYYLDSLQSALKDLNLCINHSKELGYCYYWRGFIYLETGFKEQGCKDLRASFQMGYEQATTDYKKHCDCENEK